MHYEIKEFKIPTKNTKPIHREAPEKTVFLLVDHPSGEARTTGTPITNKKERTINAKTASWNTIVMVTIPQKCEQIDLMCYTAQYDNNYYKMY